MWDWEIWLQCRLTQQSHISVLLFPVFCPAGWSLKSFFSDLLVCFSSWKHKDFPKLQTNLWNILVTSSFLDQMINPLKGWQALLHDVRPDLLKKPFIFFSGAVLRADGVDELHTLTQTHILDSFPPSSGFTSLFPAVWCVHLSMCFTVTDRLEESVGWTIRKEVNRMFAASVQPHERYIYFQHWDLGTPQHGPERK